MDGNLEKDGRTCVDQHEKLPQGKLQERIRARALAVQALYQWGFGAASIEEVFSQFNARHNLPRGVRDYFEELASEAVVAVDELDLVLGKVASLPLEMLSPVILATLRLAACELKKRPQIPPAVVISEATRLAQRFGPPEAAPFVTGALNQLVRTRTLEDTAL